MTDNGGPIYDAARRSLGERRLKEFVEANAQIDFMKLALVLSIATTVGTGTFTDEELDAISTDADDLLEAAVNFADWAKQVADEWRAQRTERT